MSLTRFRTLRLLPPALLLLPAAGTAQHGAPTDGRVQLRTGVHAVPLLTHVTPIQQGAALTEAYLTQPTLLGQLFALDGRIELRGALSLEPLTLERGELGAGAYGEGYVDRRHPHTYLHELMLTVQGDVGPANASAAIGRGFVAFGTDDPMMRPFVKFPVNHHLGQVLERLVATGGVRFGAVLAEASLFNGNEPSDPQDYGSLDRFADSWSARLTLLPLPGIEVQASRAQVTSPEMPAGGGTDQRKWSASARYDRTHGAGDIYALIEWKRTTELDRGLELFSFGSMLAEASLARSGWRPALRIERSERPEEERTFNPFRSPWPHGGSHGMGLTRWTIIAGRLEKHFAARGMSAAPFIEASLSHVQETAGGLFEPDLFYGSNRIRTLNIGARLRAGWHPWRMGRYGVAAGRMTAAPATHRH
jgi:hypothetical protein